MSIFQKVLSVVVIFFVAITTTASIIGYGVGNQGVTLQAAFLISLILPFLLILVCLGSVAESQNRKVPSPKLSTILYFAVLTLLLVAGSIYMVPEGGGNTLALKFAILLNVAVTVVWGYVFYNSTDTRLVAMDGNG